MTEFTESKDTFFRGKGSINCRGRLLSLEKPVIMGILNVTPDSFFDGGKHTDSLENTRYAGQMLEAGASIIDIGGVSTRPGAPVISKEEELERIMPSLQSIRKEFPDCIISIDTWRAEVVRTVAGEGADIINDISGGSLDDNMFSAVGETGLPYILMHIRGDPSNMQDDPRYDDLMGEVCGVLSEKLAALRSHGVKDVIIDPGFGFGKTVEHNYILLDKLDILARTFELPVLAGLSRKSMIGKVLGIKPEQALNGTSVLNTISLLRGASILRAHDVREAAECITLVEQLKKTQNALH